MKKLITLFAVAALGAALIGCSSGESTDTAATAGTTGTAAATAGTTGDAAAK